MKTNHHLTKILVQFTLLSMGLIFYRVFKSNSLMYLFLVWNLFLAWIPYLISQHCFYDKNFKGWERKIILFIWLIFLPNSPYIFTDLFHLQPRQGIPQWYDLMVILFPAITAYMLFLLSVNDFFTRIHINYTLLKAKIVKYGIFLAVGYGLYLGRYLRFNSWDVISDPIDLIGSIFISIFHPAHIEETWGITFVFGIFLNFSYKLFAQIIELKKQDYGTQTQEPGKSSY